MDWHFTDEDCIRHKDGHTITLGAGAWFDPINIIPQLHKIQDAKKGAKLVEEGLYFAKIMLLEGEDFECL